MRLTRVLDRIVHHQTAERPPLDQGTIDDLLQRGFSRRSLGRVLALATAGAALPFAHEGTLAQLSNLGERLPPGAVKINANEFPWGPTPAALEEIARVAALGNRYQYEEMGDLLATIAEQEGVPVKWLWAYPGSSLALHHAVIAFTSPQAPLVTATPGYEAAAKAAEFIGAPVIKVPLLADGRHDTRTMVAEAAQQGAGLLYMCSPNNPTGSITPKADIDWLIANKPAATVVLRDEAYQQFTGEPGCTDHVRAERDVVVIRTFSKIYGMAGLRAGYAMARPELLGRMTAFCAGAMPATAMAAARVMLLDSKLVPERRELMSELRGELCGFFERHGFAFVPSQCNMVMVETGQPCKQVIAALKEHQIYIGRPWPEWPTHVRISLGKPEELERFERAFLEVTRRS